MFWLFDDQRPWFRHKTHGYGAGLPLAWQGWALVLLHIALVVGLTVLLRDKPLARLAAVLATAILPLPIYAARTDGGWRWRWGNDK